MSLNFLREKSRRRAAAQQKEVKKEEEENDLKKEEAAKVVGNSEDGVGNDAEPARKYAKYRLLAQSTQGTRLISSF